MSSPPSSDPGHQTAQSTVSVQSLGSGSSGNGFLMQSGDTCLMLDFGIGIRTVNRALLERGLRLSDLDAVLVTHEHSDHIKTLSCVAGKDIPIVSTAGTRRWANIPPPQWEQIDFHRPVLIGDLSVWAIAVSHDAAEPCGYLIETPETRISVFTDLGSWHERLAEPIRASDLIVLESNHDEQMLLRGPYPAYLKKRVASAVGHLSNADCAASLAGTLGPGTGRPAIWLAHLSETNNDPGLARQVTVEALAGRDLALDVIALPRRSAGPVWTPSGTRTEGDWRPHPGVAALNQLSFEAMF